MAMAAAGSAGASAQSDTQSSPNQHVTVRVLDRCSGEYATFDVTFNTLVHETSDGTVSSYVDQFVIDCRG
jgi:hypothetical protein